MAPSAVGVSGGGRKTLKGALCGKGEMSIESFPGDDAGIGGVVTRAAGVRASARGEGKRWN